MSIWIWLVLIYALIGIVTNIVAIVKEPIILYAGLWLIPYFILGVIIFPYVLYTFTKPSHGRWI